MSSAYLDWLTDLFEEAQVDVDEQSADYIDGILRKLAECGPDTEDEVVYATLRDRWLRHGPNGRQLLAGLLRNHVFARRDSPLRPTEGVGYYVNPE